MTVHTVSRDRATVWLYQGDDLDRIRDLEAAAIAAKGKPRLKHEADPAKEHDDFVIEAQGRAVKVVLEALVKRAWRELVAENPPRDGNEADANVGVNEDTFADALVPLSIVEPEFPSDAARAEWVESLSLGNFDRLYLTAFRLNRGTAAPKADLSSRLARSSEKR